MMGIKDKVVEMMESFGVLEKEDDVIISRKAVEQKDHKSLKSGSMVESGYRNVGSVKKDMRFSVIEILSFDDAQFVANSLKSFNTVVVNFEGVDEGTRKRVIDFISGAVYALSGRIEKISHKVFLCTPCGVDASRTSNTDREGSDDWMRSTKGDIAL